MHDFAPAVQLHSQVLDLGGVTSQAWAACSKGVWYPLPPVIVVSTADKGAIVAANYPGWLDLRIPTIVTAHTDERDRCSVRASVVFRV